MLKRIFQSVFGHQSTPPVSTQSMVDQEDYDLLQLQLSTKEQEIERLQEQITYLQNNPQVHYVDREVRVDHFTMSPESFKRFKSKLETPICTASTTQVQANYFLGMCRVLNHLEAEHVTSR